MKPEKEIYTNALSFLRCLSCSVEDDTKNAAA
jgi:hypothetical protein